MQVREQKLLLLILTQVSPVPQPLSLTHVAPRADVPVPVPGLVGVSGWHAPAVHTSPLSHWLESEQGLQEPPTQTSPPEQLLLLVHSGGAGVTHVPAA